MPTAIAFGKTGSEWSLFTAGRDQVINVFNSAYKLKSTVPVFEVLEGLVVLSACGAGAGSVTIATAGNKGHIRVWSCDNDSLALKLEGETYVGMLLGDSERTPCVI